jgi:hypothetical protein
LLVRIELDAVENRCYEVLERVALIEAHLIGHVPEHGSNLGIGDAGQRVRGFVVFVPADDTLLDLGALALQLFHLAQDRAARFFLPPRTYSR